MTCVYTQQVSLFPFSSSCLVFFIQLPLKRKKHGPDLTPNGKPESVFQKESTQKKLKRSSDYGQSHKMTDFNVLDRGWYIKPSKLPQLPLTSQFLRELWLLDPLARAVGGQFKTCLDNFYIRKSGRLSQFMIRETYL
jgi:hypothetical protein